MKWVRFSKYVDDDLGIDSQALMDALADFFLKSGFDSQFAQYTGWDPNSLDELMEAIRRALQQGDLFDPDRAEELRRKLDAMSPEQVDQLLKNLIQKLADDKLDQLLYRSREL